MRMYLWTQAQEHIDKRNDIKRSSGHQNDHNYGLNIFFNDYEQCNNLVENKVLTPSCIRVFRYFRRI